MGANSHQPRHLGLDIKVSVFSEEWQSADAHVAVLDLFEFVNFYYILEPAVLEQKLERGVLELSAIVARNNDVLHLVADLQQGLKQNMVLMIMGDQHVIDGVR